MNISGRKRLYISIVTIAIICATALLVERSKTNQQLPRPELTTQFEELAESTESSLPESALEKVDLQQFHQSGEILEDLTGDQREQFLRAKAALYSSPELVNPHSRYLSNIDAAREGDPHAQYEVSRALQQCSESPRSQRLDEIRNDESFTPETKAIIEFKAAECSEMHASVDSEMTSVDKAYYLESAAVQGHPLAILQRNLTSGVGPEVDKQNLFRDALKLRSPDIYRLMMFYHSMHSGGDDVEMRAWGIHRCSHDPTCNPDDVVYILVAGSLPAQSDAVISRLQEIRTALDSENWDLLIPTY